MRWRILDSSARGSGVERWFNLVIRFLRMAVGCSMSFLIVLESLRLMLEMGRLVIARFHIIVSFMCLRRLVMRVGRLETW